MIKHLTHKNIDKQKWDDCISKSFNGIVYGCSWYLDIVCEGWEALVEGDYKTVMPLTAGKKYGITYLYPPAFTQQLGVFSTDVLSEELVLRFINNIPPKFKFFEFNLNTFNKLSSPGYQLKKNINCELDLIDSYQNLFQKYSDNTKRNVKKAQENNIRISFDVTIDELIEMFRANRGNSIKRLQTKHYDMLKTIVERSKSKGLAKLIGVKSAKNKLCAGAVFIVSKEKIIFLFSASNREAKENRAMFFLIDNFIRENSQRNLILDFEGSNDADLARFYKGFGSKECTYVQVRKNNLPWYIKWMKGK